MRYRTLIRSAGIRLDRSANARGQARISVSQSRLVHMVFKDLRRIGTSRCRVMDRPEQDDFFDVTHPGRFRFAKVTYAYLRYGFAANHAWRFRSGDIAVRNHFGRERIRILGRSAKVEPIPFRKTNLCTENTTCCGKKVLLDCRVSRKAFTTKPVGHVPFRKKVVNRLIAIS